MPSKPRIYRRLSGRGTTLAHYVRLFQGPDHLLQVSSTGYSEIYKRFYFRDIQAVLIQKTHWGKMWTGFWAVLAGFFALLALSTSGAGEVALWIIAGVFAGALLINLALGPTCNCHVKTAVQTEKLPTLRRLKTARRFLKGIRPRVEAVQGRLTTEEIAQALQAPGRLSGYQVAAPPVIQADRPAPPVIAPDESAPPRQP